MALRLTGNIKTTIRIDKCEEIKMLSYVHVCDVAEYILRKTGRISTWKLQKLCYYAKAWHLAWTEKDLFPEDFQAWANGPVCRELYDKHKGKFSVDAGEIGGSPDLLNDDEKETVDIIVNDYGNMEPWELRELTHREKPWKDTRGDIPDGMRSDMIINKNIMAEYYGSL